MGRTRDVSKILTANTSLLSLASASATYAPVAAGGLVQIVASSIANTGGTSSISTSGVVSFSGTTSISLNNIFSSTYTNYRVLLNVTAGSGSLYTRLRASGSNDTSANYNNYSHYGRSGNANAVLTANENSTTGNMIDEISVASYDSIDIFNPNVNTNTSAHFQGLHISPPTTGYKVMSHWGGWNHNSNYQADGITFFFGVSGTGNIVVFGYKK